MQGAKAILMAPAWRQPGYVGNYRIERFIRWLSERGDQVVVVRAGQHDGVEAMPWGEEIVVRDPLGLYSERTAASTAPAPARKPNSLRRSLAYMLFNPDPTVAWCWRAIRQQSVLQRAVGARWAIATSPPESAHVATAYLARKVGAELIVDLRDGWLDDPLRPNLQNSRLRRWREGRLEKRILRQAGRIFVTSDNWFEMLRERLPFTAGKTAVLTNAYPQRLPSPGSAVREGDRLTILYTGQLTGSRTSSRAPLLLDLLLAGLRQFDGPRGRFVFLGNLSERDRSDLAGSAEQFGQLGWKIETQPAVPREQMFEQLQRADGLLLFCASQAAIPSKVFEYIPTGKPVLAASPRDSSVWRMASELPQFFKADYRELSQAGSKVSAFLRASQQGDGPYAVPERYSESCLREIFLKAVSD